jgi:hypothetical protein
MHLALYADHFERLFDSGKMMAQSSVQDEEIPEDYVIGCA